MVRHIVLLQFKDELTDEQKVALRAELQRDFDGLQSRIPGVLSIRLIGQGVLPTADADVMLDASFESFDALKECAVHPLHAAIAESKIRPNVKTRICMDYEE